jgi:iron-chelate-transporting ATPase
MIEARNICVRHGGEAVLDIDRIGFDGRGLTAILGHNGSGKSTLMKVLARQMRPDYGTVTLDGQPLASFAQRALARRLAYLPQQLPEAAGMTVSELVKLGRFAWRGTVRRFTDDDHAIAREAMHLTGVDRFATRQADSLSGGERQRAWVAMLLAQSAPTLLLDEPTSALDLAHQYELVALLKKLNREAGRSVVVVLHDINLAARFADRLVVLRAGRVAFDGSPKDLMRPHLLTDLFGVAIDLVNHAPTGRPIAVVNG